MIRKHITEQPFKSIIDIEWKRAKKILRVLKHKPVFKWDDSEGLNGSYGKCNRRMNRIRVHHKFKVLNNPTEFIMLLRHEFAHLPEPSPGQSSHGNDFEFWCSKLGGTRYVSTTLRKLQQIEKAAVSISGSI